jgi:uncharacterized protein (DUF362 family)
VHPLASYLDRLLEQAHPSGGWSYRPDQAAQLEPTCCALLALSLERDSHKAAIERGRAMLETCVDADGVYRLPGGRDEAVWPTALALFTRAALGEPATALAPSAARLAQFRGRTPDDPRSAEQVDIDHRIVGWPWAENNFSWAEPTAWACLALRRAGYGAHARVREGLSLLLDRAADEGGINYGNRRVLGRTTEPQVEPTALMLMALQGTDPHPRIASALDYLRRQGLAAEDVEQLAWAKLALDLYAERPDIAEVLPAIDDRILKACALRQSTPWLTGAPLREALTALALGTGRCNYFRLSATTNGVPELPAVAAERRAPGWAGRLKGAIRGLALHGAGQLRPLPAESLVHIARAERYEDDLVAILRGQYEHFRERVPLGGKRIVLKPNLVEYHRDKVINTDPRVVGAVIELCRHEGAAEVVVAEGPGHCRNVEHLVRASGLGEVLEHHKVAFRDLNHDEPVKTLNLGRLTGLDYLYLARTITTAEVVISLPKLKTHHWAGATLSLKNLFGTLPGICYGWPKNELHWRGIDNSIVDIALTRTPELAIVDAIVGMEGDGPLNGTPRPLGALVMGADLLAVDATCCRLMQLAPERIGYLVLGERKKLGLLAQDKVRQIGEPIDALARPFATVPHLQGLRAGQSA